MIAIGRMNRPALIVYGGTIKPGCGEEKKKLDLEDPLFPLANWAETWSTLSNRYEKEMAERDRSSIQPLGREAGSAILVHQSLQRVPVCTIGGVAKMTKLTLPTVAKALDVLVRVGIVREITGKKRHRIYSYDGYMKILSEGTELP